MSTRTIIEINHDQLNLRTAEELIALLGQLHGAGVTAMLNKTAGAPVTWSPGVRVLGQRHHSETLQLEVR